MNNSQQTTDVLVIGAGPSGCVSASYLANKGYNVTIIEKANFPRFVIGESLLPSSMNHFEEVGLLAVLKEADFEIKRGAVFLQSEKVCNIDFSENFTPGWTWTWQVPREDFDKIVADETQKKGVNIQYGSTINSLNKTSEGFTIGYDKDGVSQTLSAKYIIDSSGNGKVMSGLMDIQSIPQKTNRKAFFTRVVDKNADLDSKPRQIFFDIIEQDLWFWVIPFSTGETSIGFVGDDHHFKSKDDSKELSFDEMIEKTARFKDRYRGVKPLFDPISYLDYTHSTGEMYGENYVLTGNSTGFIDPIFSSGVAIATESGLKAAKLVDKQLSGKTVDWQKEYVEYMHRGLDVFRSYIKAWYDGPLQTIFFYDGFREEMKKQITSVLAGYAWDESNSFVKNHARVLTTLEKVILIEERKNK